MNVVVNLEGDKMLYGPIPMVKSGKYLVPDYSKPFTARLVKEDGIYHYEREMPLYDWAR